MVMLRLLHTIVHNSGVVGFVRDNLRLRQKMTMTSGRGTGLNHRLVVELSDVTRQQSLADFSEIAFQSLLKGETVPLDMFEVQRAIDLAS